MRLFIIFFLLSSILTTSQSVTNSFHLIIGKVTNKKNGQIIPNCNIYLSGTEWGTVSGLNGKYSLKCYVPSNYELVFSNIGFKKEIVPISIANNNKILEVDIGLTPIEYEIDDILIESNRAEEWEENLEKFKRYFLGYTKFADDCNIENEIYINFNQNDPNKLKASISQPLTIINHALGFKINCDLIKFEYDNKESRVQYIITSHFSNIDTNDLDILEEFRENRYEAYKGSLDHFLFSLKNNTFMDEGFEVSTSKIPYHHGQELYRDYILTADSILTYDTLNNKYILKFDDFLQVRFNNSNRTRTPISWILLNSDEVSLDQHGAPFEIMPFTTYGSWSNNGVSNLLPKYYYVFKKEEKKRME